MIRVGVLGLVRTYTQLLRNIRETVGVSGRWFRDAEKSNLNLTNWNGTIFEF